MRIRRQESLSECTGPACKKPTSRPTEIHSNQGVCIHTYIYQYDFVLHTYLHTYIHTYIRTYVRTSIHAYTDAHTGHSTQNKTAQRNEMHCTATQYGTIQLLNRMPCNAMHYDAMQCVAGIALHSGIVVWTVYIHTPSCLHTFQEYIRTYIRTCIPSTLNQVELGIKCLLNSRRMCT